MKTPHHLIMPRSVLLLVAVLMVSACATRSGDNGAEGGQGASITIVVDNNLPAAGSLSIYAVPDVGGRRAVGHIGAAQTARLSFPATNPASYRFLAEGLGGARIVSNPVSLRPGETVHWDLSSNVAIPSSE